jgi:hypothetical protein
MARLQLKRHVYPRVPGRSIDMDQIRASQAWEAFEALVFFMKKSDAVAPAFNYQRRL